MPIIDISSPASPKTPPFETAADTAPVADIVAVHGILQTGVAAWTDDDSGIVWLRDLFPHRKLRARVLVHEYDAKAFLTPGNGTVDRILRCAQNFVAELSADRQLSDALRRPIIFVCHGFGGLLVKRALAFSSTRRTQNVEHLRSIYISTFGVLFLGTPHTGILKESLITLESPKSQGPNQLALNLLKDSEMLQEITDQFAPLMKRFAIYNFWEENPTHRDGKDILVVGESSAAPAWHDTEKCGLRADHYSLAKFTRKSDSGYRVVIEALARYINRSPNIIARRWNEDAQALASERQHEAEALLRPHIRHTSSEYKEHGTQNLWFIVPRCSSSYFTGRRSYAEKVREQLGVPNQQHEANRHRTFVIYGLGGAGKTQFCLKYVEDNKARYWGIFWIDASSDKNAEAAFAYLGQQAGKGTSFTAGLHWLSQCSEPWLLVIDNADDPEMDVSKYFPAGNSGHILITTRNPNVSIHATAGSIRLSGMDPQEAVSLLLKTASLHNSSPMFDESPKWKTAESIASELGYLALALAHAGMTIRRKIYTLERYLHYYLGHRKRMIASIDIRSADEANIITTWEIPFEKIASRNSIDCKDAVDLMHVMAFMHFESIPEIVLRGAWNFAGSRAGSLSAHPFRLIRSDTTRSEESQIRVRRALGVLCDHSIIDYDPEKGMVSLHTMVQRWAQDRLAPEKRQKCLDMAIALIAGCISPYMEASGQRSRGTFLSHIESCLQALRSLYGTNLFVSAARATEIERFAWVFAENGLWKRARELQQGVLAFRMKSLGRRHEETIHAQRSLAESEWNLFEIKSAIMLQLQTLGACWFMRPSYADWLRWPPWYPEHTSYCITLSDLTLSLWLAGRRDRSKQVGERAVAGLKKQIGTDDPLTLTAMFNLARTYLHLGQRKACHDLLVEVLRKRKHYFGLEHPDTLMTRNELGMYYCAEGRCLPIAERLIQNVLTSRKRILGEEHAYTLWSMNDLAKVISTRGRSDEAIKILEQVVAIAHRTLGDEHPGMTMTKSNLARALVLSKRWAEAEILLREGLPRIPETHPDWAHHMSGIIYVLTAMDRFDEASSCCQQVLGTASQKSIPLPRLLAVAQQLLLIYHKQGRSSDIAALQQRFPSLEFSDKQTFNVWHT